MNIGLILFQIWKTDDGGGIFNWKIDPRKSFPPNTTLLDHWFFDSFGFLHQAKNLRITEEKTRKPESEYPSLRWIRRRQEPVAAEEVALSPRGNLKHLKSLIWNKIEGSKVF